MHKETKSPPGPGRPAAKPQRRAGPGAQLVTWVLLAVVLIGQLLLLFRWSGAPSSPTSEPTARIREYANALVEDRLYAAAAAEYEKLLAAPGLDADERANLTFLLANLYKDDAHDYAKALQYYLRVKHLYPNSNIADKVGPQIVECLERLGRSLDAQLELEAQTQLPADKTRQNAPAGDAVVARLGKREITYSELEKQIRNLPDYLRKQFDQPQKKLDFLRQYVATELLYDKARRLNLDKDPEIVENAFQVKKSMMVQKLLDQEVRQKVTLSPADIKLYYEAHKDRYQKRKDGKVVGQQTLLEARKQVEADLRQEREQAAQRKLLEQLLQAENVQIYSDLFLPASSGKELKPRRP